MFARALSLKETGTGNLNKMIEVAELCVRAALRSGDPEQAEQHERDIEAMKRTRELIQIYGDPVT